MNDVTTGHPFFQAPPGARARPAAGNVARPDRTDLGGEPDEHASTMSGWRKALLLGGLAVTVVSLAGCVSQSSVPVTNAIGLTEGYADQEGNYYDGVGARLGSVDENGSVWEFFGPYLGKVSDDGTVSGLLLPRGSVSPDGVVRNAFGWQTGRVQGQDPNRLEPVEKAGAALLLLHED
ncbi:MAG: hypothetical protein AB1758_00140 [Candidatus Eremiobacterota bacterium]